LFASNSAVGIVIGCPTTKCCGVGREVEAEAGADEEPITRRHPNSPVATTPQPTEVWTRRNRRLVRGSGIAAALRRVVAALETHRQFAAMLSSELLS
jgi:hypothetical protein